MRKILHADAKPQRRQPAGSSPRTVPIWKRTWTDVEPGKYSFSDYEVSKKVVYLLCYGKQVHGEDDGAVQFWRIKENLQKHFPHSPHWSDSKWNACLAGGGRRNKRRFQYCIDSLGTIVYLRALQGHSGRNLIDPSLQDNVIIQSNFFQYMYHVGCAFNLHSIISSGLILGSQSLSKRQTVFFLPVDPVDKNHKDPDVIDLSVPRRAQYLHKAWKKTSRRNFLGRHQSCYWEKDWNSIRPERMQSSFKKHFQLVVFRKLLGWKLAKSFSKKYTCHLGLHQRSPENTNGKENWVQHMLNDQKLGSYLEVSNRTNQFYVQVVREWGDPLSRMTWSMCKMKENVPFSGDRC